MQGFLKGYKGFLQGLKGYEISIKRFLKGFLKIFKRF